MAFLRLKSLCIVKTITLTLKDGCLYYWFPENSCLFPHHVLVIDELCNLISSILLLTDS